MSKYVDTSILKVGAKDFSPDLVLLDVLFCSMYILKNLNCAIVSITSRAGKAGLQRTISPRVSSHRGILPVEGVPATSSEPLGVFKAVLRVFFILVFSDHIIRKRREVSPGNQKRRYRICCGFFCLAVLGARVNTSARKQRRIRELRKMRTQTSTRGKDGGVPDGISET